VLLTPKAFLSASDQSELTITRSTAAEALKKNQLDELNPYVGFFRHAPRASPPSCHLSHCGLGKVSPSFKTRLVSSRSYPTMGTPATQCQ